MKTSSNASERPVYQDENVRGVRVNIAPAITPHAVSSPKNDGLLGWE
jgi:hypothetical protein